MAWTRHSTEPHPSAAPSVESGFQVNLASFSIEESDFPHALFAPMHYTPGYAYPLIVWLHGRGSDERQLQRVMPLVSMQNYVAVAPRGLQMPDAAETGRPCYEWLQTEEHIQRAGQRVFDAIGLAGRKFHVSPQRVFLAGFDGGGTMAMRIALGHPQRFAGVLSLCGAFPSGRTPFCNLVAARRLAIFLATGRGSLRYPAEQVCDDLRLLHTAGLSVTLRQHPCGDELMPQMLADVDRWIIEQITAPPPVPAKSNAESL
ncbi:MAG: alpha/beta hydrolase-fold protein [Thermoguttaceae bacterium]